MSKSGKHFVIVQDDSVTRELLAEVLDLLGTPNTYTFLNGEGDVQLWLGNFQLQEPETLPDAILVDLEVPGQQSTAVIRHLRAFQALKHTKMILSVSSGLPREQLESIVQQCHPDRVIVRPRQGASGLSDLVDELIRQSSQESQAN